MNLQWIFDAKTMGLSKDLKPNDIAHLHNPERRYDTAPNAPGLGPGDDAIIMPLYAIGVRDALLNQCVIVTPWRRYSQGFVWDAKQP